MNTERLAPRRSDAARLPLDSAVSERVLSRVGVSAPYVDLHDLRFERSTLLTSTVASFTPTAERGPVRAAELCRHAGVAGLCASAWQQRNDERHYYLLEQLRYQSTPYVSAVSDLPYGSSVDLSAQASVAGSQARAVVSAGVGRVALATLEFIYNIYSVAAFERAFASRRRPAPFFVKPVWAVPRAPVVREGFSYTRKMAVHPASCQGHFERYPCLPFALVMADLTELGGSSLRGAYCCTTFDLRVSDLCWANDRIKLSVTPAGTQVAGRTRGTVSFSAQVQRGRERPVVASFDLRPV